MRVCGTAIHRCQCVCLCQRSSVIAVVREALAPGYPSGVCLPLHFGYVHFCSCASSCSELLLVNLCSWRSPVIHRCWDPSLFVVVSVVPGGQRNFLHAHQCTCQCHHFFMPWGSCQALVLGHQSGVGIPGHFLGGLVHWDQGRLSAHIGRPVPPCVFGAHWHGDLSCLL